MSIFPPSGIDDNAADGADPVWVPWFAWFPVSVGNNSWAWLTWVESRLRPDGPPPLDMPKMQYRLPPS
jgi:hypothetical protein